jgi:hypothetical protein
MNEIPFNDKFESVWCRDTSSVEKTLDAIKQPVVYSDILKKIMKQYSFN